jgi:hypothetical protein
MSRPMPTKPNLSHGRASVILVTAVLLLSTAFTSSAFAYGCGSPYCYGVNWWDYRSDIGGNSTTVSLTDISCNIFCGQSGAITEEMWLGQTIVGSNCSVYVACWIEVGTYAACCSKHYFYAYIDQNNTTYKLVPLGDVPSGDLGGNGTYSIYPDALTPNQWDVELNTPTDGDRLYFVTNSSLAPTGSRIGSELHGIAGASAPATHFTQNQWYTSTTGWTYVTANGNLHVDSPESAAWSTTPSSSSSGGDFQTSCC